MQIQPGATRPSGATIRVLKTYTSADECRAQIELAAAAGPWVALPMLPLDANSATMPLATPLTPDRMGSLVGIYENLWAKHSRRGCRREAYHDYVFARGAHDESELGHRAMLAVTMAYQNVRDLPIEQSVFVHGDATASNAVLFNNAVRLIDFSPREAPPEREIDVAKLVFSGLGFDTEQKDGYDLVRTAMTVPGISETLVKYYLLTHLIRVASREPAVTTRRFSFYERVLRHGS